MKVANNSKLSTLLFSVCLLFSSLCSLEAANFSRRVNVLSDFSTPIKIVIGIGIALISLAILLVSAYCYASYYLHLPADQREKRNRYSLARTSSYLTLPLGALLLAFIVKWTETHSSTDSTDDLFLGKPNLKTNLFAFHPIFMTGGFFLSQVLGIVSYSFSHMTEQQIETQGEEYIGRNLYRRYKRYHIILQCISFCLMFLGLWVVIDYKNAEVMYGYGTDDDEYNTQNNNSVLTSSEVKSPHFTSIHSWIGIFSIGLFVFNFSYGIFSFVIMRCFPASVLLKAFSLHKHHKHLGLLTLWFTSMALTTGIMNYFYADSCYPVDTNTYEGTGYSYTISKSYNQDSAKEYPDIPRACKIGYGVAVIAMVLTTLVFVAVLYRGDSFGKENWVVIEDNEPGQVELADLNGQPAVPSNGSSTRSGTRNAPTAPSSSRRVPIGTDAHLARGLELDAIYANVEVIPSQSSVEVTDVQVIVDNSPNRPSSGELVAANAVGSYPLVSSSGSGSIHGQRL